MVKYFNLNYVLFIYLSDISHLSDQLLSRNVSFRISLTGEL